MTSLVPRSPYTDDELKTLYPPTLELQLVQVLLRHGERSPVSARFQNAGLPAFWPYCSAVRQMKSAVLDRHHNQFTTMEWKRRLETFGSSDEPVLAAGPAGELDGVCEMGMLTDKGRETTFDLGTRLRELYVERLRFLPPVLLDAEAMYLRATPIPRALDSVQETFTGLYPAHTRAPAFPAPAILTRAPGDETLFPNDSNCRRFAALSRAFAQRAADRWNDTEEMAYLTRLWGKWMPEDAPRVAVDSRPRLSGIMDTINSTLAHGPSTRLPKEFYDPKGREIIEKIGVEEWFAGYKESREYRALGIGGLLGDVVGRMVGSAERSTADGGYEVAKKLESSTLKEGKGATPVRFGLSGCHDTTLAAVLASLGAYEGNKWPPYTSHIAIEMFRKAGDPSQQGNPAGTKSSWFGSWGSSTKPGNPPSGTIGRKRSEELSPAERAKLQDYYVRLRFNDEVVTVPGCRAPGKHLEGDESFCTLDAFKAIVDKFVPNNWRQECRANIKGPVFPSKPEPAGY
ncbi:phosphoglycerate mutase-like protein [Annulohypoxylon maeteangense]|uniref:phosphoglycerate mutase-like protein n=1 Tax=Annulohypoxylon maeteangense TaxID=1927788 RepID=UPI00200722BF|nr:phosphoglycerate mutase-like protein [Annulohypoxylon maeteangense]KAI0887198.1 phosphoglycerate mutase-like protein [Annulohypoxylon maeteangense]